MKEQTDSVSFAEATESHDRKSMESEERKINKNPKTRQIHKEKITSGRDQQVKEQKNKLTKEERAKIQKEKNREAAQRSRDMHKEYVTKLQNEIKYLREECSQNRRYCYRCKQALDSQDSELCSQLTFPSNQDNIHQLVPEESNLINEPNNTYAEPESFLRVLQPQEENSILKMMLFVCMIAIAVMVGFNNSESTQTQPRGLMQLYTQPNSQPMQGEALEMRECTSSKQIVGPHRGLEDQTCLDSLMRVETPTNLKSLRSIHDHSYSAEDMDSIMLCSLKTPKLYQIKPEISQNPVVRLFVLGSEIKDLVSRSGEWMSLLQRNIQLNGIYRLSAEIKNVELVSHHNCLL